MSHAEARNRRDEALPSGVIELVNAAGETKRLEGEQLLVTCAGHYSGMKPLKLGTPAQDSLLSGAPAYLVRVDDVEVALTADEFVHLALHALNPAQYRQLRETFGVFSLIEAEYYDPQSGKALQPKVRIPTPP